MTVANILFILAVLLSSWIGWGIREWLLFLGAYSISFLFVFVLSHLLTQKKQYLYYAAMMILSILVGILTWFNSYGPRDSLFGASVATSLFSSICIFLSMRFGNRLATRFDHSRLSYVGVAIGALILTVTVIVIYMHGQLGGIA